MEKFLQAFMRINIILLVSLWSSGGGTHLVYRNCTERFAIFIEILTENINIPVNLPENVMKFSITSAFCPNCLEGSGRATAGEPRVATPGHQIVYENLGSINQKLSNFKSDKLYRLKMAKIQTNTKCKPSIPQPA